MLLVVGAAPSMAKGAASVESAGGADKATVAAIEALGPRAYGGAGGVQNATTWRGMT